MSALRWEQPDDELSFAESLASVPGPVRDPRRACAEDDDPARGIVLGVAASLIGFWLPLAAIAAFKWTR
jgi:hypothetical protein